VRLRRVDTGRSGRHYAGLRNGLPALSATLNLPLESANPHPGPGVLPAPPFPRSERDWSSIPQDAWGAAASYAKRRGARAAPVESRDGPSNYSDVD
jgi:hypothetical protein